MSSQVDHPASRGGVAQRQSKPRPDRHAAPAPPPRRNAAGLPRAWESGGRAVPGDVCPGGEQAGRAPRFLPNGIARPQDRTAPRRRSSGPVVVGVLPSDPFATDADELILWDTLGCRNYSSRGIRRLDPSAARRPKHPDLRRSGSYSVPFASAWRDRGDWWAPGSHPPCLRTLNRSQQLSERALPRGRSVAASAMRPEASPRPGACLVRSCKHRSPAAPHRAS
jgi:hypothetical protein